MLYTYKYYVYIDRRWPLSPLYAYDIYVCIHEIIISYIIYKRARVNRRRRGRLRCVRAPTELERRRPPPSSISPQPAQPYTTDYRVAIAASAAAIALPSAAVQL